MEVYISNPDDKSLGSFSELTIKFDEEVLEWAKPPGAYTPLSLETMPFETGSLSSLYPSAAAAQNLFFLNAPEKIYNDAKDSETDKGFLDNPGLGNFNARFNFDSADDITRGGSLLIINLRVKSGNTATQTSLSMNVARVSSFGDEDVRVDYINIAKGIEGGAELNYDAAKNIDVEAGSTGPEEPEWGNVRGLPSATFAANGPGPADVIMLRRIIAGDTNIVEGVNYNIRNARIRGVAGAPGPADVILLRRHIAGDIAAPAMGNQWDGTW
jgi:hypothetical protein